MLKFLQNKKILLKCLTALLFVGTTLYAQTSKSCEYRTFNIKLNETVTINEMLTQLSDLCNFSMVVKDPQAKTILSTTLQGINIKNMSLYEVFDLLVKENNLNYKFEKDILKVSALLTQTFKLDYITSKREGTATLNASVSATPREAGDTGTAEDASDNEIKVTEQFDFWKTLDAEITAILNNGKETYVAKAPIINTQAGLITITGTKQQLERVEDYIKNVKERLHKQVLIDVSIISVELEDSKNEGINWSKFQLSLSGTESTGETSNWNDASNKLTFTKSLSIVNNASFSMEGLMNFIRENGKTKIISSPKVITLNNQQALITVGDNINYRVPEETSDSDSNENTVTYSNYSIFIGVLLNILPEISENDEIMLRINPSLSNFKYTSDDTQQTTPREIAPDTTEKKLSTVVHVNSGDTIILGGLIENSKGKENTSVPVLSEVPLLGSAFKSSTDTITSTELVFVITPHIIGKKGLSQVSLKDLGYSETTYE